jgi:hypothetical protein
MPSNVLPFPGPFISKSDDVSGLDLLTAVDVVHRELRDIASGRVGFSPSLVGELSKMLETAYINAVRG